MAAKIIDGNKIATEIRQEIKERVAKLKEKGITPKLSVVLVGDDPASISYITSKAKGCDEIGMCSETIKLPADATEMEVMGTVDALNKDPEVHGILVQLPLPKHIKPDNIINYISPEKDVDAFTPLNLGKLMRGEEAFLPCTPHGIYQLLVRSGVNLKGAEVVIVGASNIVGRPLTMLLSQEKDGLSATVTLCHMFTKDISIHTKRADVLIVAVGKANLVTANMVKEGVVVIDVGINRIGKTESGKAIIVGDVDFEGIKEKASAITPVPGGVGPMTVTMLLVNTVEAAERTIKGCCCKSKC